MIQTVNPAGSLSRLQKSAILGTVILMYWVIGYYPINPLPEFNNGAILQGQEKLRLPTPGIAYTRKAPDWLGDAIKSSSLDISLYVQPAAIDQKGPARILSISANTGYRNIMVGQQGGDLVVRLRRSVDTFNGVPPFVVTNVFNNLDRHAFFVSVKPGMLSVSVDGITKLTAKLPDHALDTWAHDYRLILGNEITFDRPWLGVIREATIAVNGRRLDYLANGALAVPAIYYLQPQSDRTQLIPFYRWSYSPGAFKDWAVNFIGFIPLGFLFIVLYPRWSRVWRIGLVCLGVSLVIETMQLFLPWRHPGVEDLTLNTLGGATGAWAGIKYWQQGEYDPTSR